MWVRRVIDEALAKKLRLLGITKAARSPFFQGKRKDVSAGNFERHCCFLCGTWLPCEMEKCTHAVCVRVLKCCDPLSGQNRTERKRKGSANEKEEAETLY